MPNRILRDYTDSLRFDGIPADAERLFIRLIMKADDYGRYHAEPRLLRSGCFPLSDHLRVNDLIRWLDELSSRQLILRYEVGGRKFLALVNFGQRLRTSRAKFPPPDGAPPDFMPDRSGGPPSADNCQQPAVIRGDLRPESESESETSLESEGAGARTDGSGGKPGDGFAEFWNAYPKRVGQPVAQKAWASPSNKCSEIRGDIMMALAKARVSFDWTKEGGQFIPHPATWLNRHGWKDEYKAAAAGLTGRREKLIVPIE